jgi:translation initiation factor 2D
LKAFTPPPPISPLSPNPTTPSEAGPSRPRSPPSLDELTLESSTQQIEPLSPSEISTLLSLSLIQSLSDFPSSSLPIPASLLYSSYILPNRPAFIPVGNRDDVVIAKSEWKKLAKWMKEISKDGLVKTKETKGEIIITG